MTNLRNKRIAILATDGFEKSELFEPRDHLQRCGAEVTVISPDEGSIRSWDDGDWGERISVDKRLSEIRFDEYDALVLPGGQINPDLLRRDKEAVTFVRNFFNTGRPLAAICHAPWMLIEAGVVRDRQLTSYDSIRTDLQNAGAHWRDEAVVVDDGLITSRSPADLEAFNGKIAEEIREGRHQRIAA